ncbi:unnamed protein product [Candidula unifasciata]|uniref:Uncharacterized protein n=1 Tax=Candidula unifasciata TaxID=100452 RepID=A0A8S4A230_9EUPU|nr:unnamed protein product [Candidula unifasciata]
MRDYFKCLKLNKPNLSALNWIYRSMSGEPAIKKACNMVKIGTHDGKFHCDEVLACFLLKQLDQYKHAEIVRTRNPVLLDECDIVVDVGAVYDPSRHRYDHHQKTFNESLQSLKPGKKWVTKLSSAGLVYVHFGADIIASILNVPSGSSSIDTIYDKVYENFIEEIDAIDNGIDQTDSVPRYRITTNLSSRVNGLNPKWNDKENDETTQFEKAMKMAGTEFVDRVTFYYSSWLPARDLVVQAINDRHKVDPSGQIIQLKDGAAPWKDHLFNLEEEMNLPKPIVYVLFPDKNEHWRVQCVPASLNSFENRVSIKEEWRGLRDEELSQTSGIKDCIFVHTSGFIGGNKTFEGALEMARQSLAQSSAV